MATVVITGATAGVGRAVARAFAGRGDSVGLLARELTSRLLVGDVWSRVTRLFHGPAARAAR